MRTALIDGDTLLYAASASNEYEVQWDTWLWTLHADFNAAVEQVHRMVEEITTGLGADRVIMALTDDTNWRKEVMPTYKFNRVAKRKPTVYKPLREYAHEKWETFQRPTLEGDDVLGILATHPKLVEGDKVVVSIDKDLKTIPGKHSNYTKDNVAATDWTIHTVTPAMADFYHLYQTLTGDTSDGYPGCPKIGPVTAIKVLGYDIDSVLDFTVAEAWPKVVAAYAKQGLGEEVALQNARVARICRAEDYDFKEKRVKLWQPNISAP